MIMELFVASVITYYTDNTSLENRIRFYKLQDCQLYIKNIDLTSRKDMVLDDKLVWTIKQIKKVNVNCVKSSNELVSD